MMDTICWDPLKHISLIGTIIFTDEAGFTKNGIMNLHNLNVHGFINKTNLNKKGFLENNHFIDVKQEYHFCILRFKLSNICAVSLSYRVLKNNFKGS